VKRARRRAATPRWAHGEGIRAAGWTIGLGDDAGGGTGCAPATGSRLDAVLTGLGVWRTGLRTRVDDGREVPVQPLNH
jgi:hypothetical protein